MRHFLVCLSLAALLLPAAGSAQTQKETLADIRQELSILHVEIQKLKRELSTTGSAGTIMVGGSVIDRMAALEGELQRLTGETEALGLRIDKVVTDGTNRIGDLEFRLVELEGGDTSKLGETSTLGGVQPQTGGGMITQPGITQPGAEDTAAQPQMAVGEKADFDAAEAALNEGRHAEAAQMFAAFADTYPGGPLSDLAVLKRGEALEGAGEVSRAARVYLDLFSAAPNGPVAPEALYLLGSALGRLGQTEEACLTLGEVGTRFPGDPAASRAQADMQNLGCQ